MEGGTAHGEEIVCCAIGVPPAAYIKEGGREEAGQVGRAKGGVLLGLLVQVGFGPPFFLYPTGGKAKGERGGRKEGARPPPLVQFGLGKGKGAPTTWPILLSSNKAQ